MHAPWPAHGLLVRAGKESILTKPAEVTMAEPS